jgi:cyclin-dependent kinase 9
MNLKRKVKERLRPYVKDSHGVDLLDKLLQLDPVLRLEGHERLGVLISTVILL